jgi:hypothetical protein
LARKEGREYSRRSAGRSNGICAWMIEQWQRQRVVVVQSGLRRGRDREMEPDEARDKADA